MKNVRILIADDHALIRDGIKKILNIEAGQEITVVGEAVNGEEAVQFARQLNPDIILMDINMPTLNGIEATKRIKEDNPEIAIIILTIHDAREYIYELMEYGASAYILKDISTEDLLNVIRIVASGDTYIDPRMTGKLIGAWRYKSEGFNIKDKLTDRELEILAEVAVGANNRTIAEKLFLSEKTVKNHITNILRKLKVNDRTQAAIYAIKHNLFDI